ncbi:MAG: HAD hydrolase family protein [Pseudomonadota bacterium]
MSKFANEIKLAVFDVDGVFTDGRLYMNADGQEAFKVFHVRDGYGIKNLLRHNIQVGVISGRSSPMVSERMRALGVKHIHMGCEDKLPKLKEMAAGLGISLSETCYLGDDSIDIDAIKAVGLGLAVNDAHPSVIAAAMAKTQASGGQGAVREVCDLLVDALDKA